MTTKATIEEILRPLAERRVASGEGLVWELAFDPRFEALRQWGHIHSEGEHSPSCITNYHDMGVDTSLDAVMTAAGACGPVVMRKVLEILWLWFQDQEIPPGLAAAASLEAAVEAQDG